MTDKTEAQPEALRLADALLEQAVHHRDLAHCCDCRPEDTVNWDHYLQCRDASKALHQLHAEIQQLKAQLSARQAVPVMVVTEAMHEAAVKVLHRANGLDGLPQRMLDAMLSAAPRPPEREPLSAKEVGGLLESAGYSSGEAKRRADFINGLRFGEMAHGIGATNDNP